MESIEEAKRRGYEAERLALLEPVRERPPRNPNTPESVRRITAAEEKRRRRLERNARINRDCVT